MKPTQVMLAAILVFCAMRAVAAPPSQVLIPTSGLAESQKGEFLCWAAASMTAYRIVRHHEGRDRGLNTPSQWLLSVYNQAHNEKAAFGARKINRLTTDDVSAPDPLAAILNKLKSETCPKTAENFGECDDTGEPILQDLDFADPVEEKPLGFCELRALMIDKRPVVFEWRSLVAPVNPGTGQPTGPEGDHYMVVVGTRVVGGKPDVRIWDPWPKGGPVAGHLQWISYNEYAHPGAEHGVIGPTHGMDFFQIRRLHNDETVLPTTCEVTIPPIVPIVPTSQPINQVQRDFLPENLRHTLPPEQLPTLERGQHFGVAFPIVGLTSAQIVRAAGNPERVRGHEASSVLLTVEDPKGRADTFVSLVHDRAGWQRAGYVNNGVGLQLAAMRKVHWEKEREARPRALSDYYMLSIPSRRTFFVAYDDPRTHETMLVPVADDAAIGAVAGKGQRASDLLLRMATDIEADWARRARQTRLRSAANDHYLVPLARPRNE